MRDNYICKLVSIIGKYWCGSVLGIWEKIIIEELVSSEYLRKKKIKKKTINSGYVKNFKE